MTPKKFRLTRERVAQFKAMSRDPMGQRKVLDAPIRVNKVVGGKQQRGIAEEIARKRRALLRHYHIPTEWDELTQLRLLVDHLAGEVFPGFRVITKDAPAYSRGGPSLEHQRKMADRKCRLLERYEAHCRKNSHIKSGLRLTELFLKNDKIRRACVAAGFVKLSPKSIFQALRKISRETTP
jgi:hypothetical protein